MRALRACYRPQCSAGCSHLDKGRRQCPQHNTHFCGGHCGGGGALTGGRCDSRHRGRLRGPRHPRRRTAWFENLEWVCIARAGQPVAVEGTHGHWRRPVQGRAAAASIHIGRQHLFTHSAQPHASTARSPLTVAGCPLPGCRPWCARSVAAGCRVHSGFAVPLEDPRRRTAVV